MDVHKKTVAVCLRVPGVHGDRVQHVRTFATTTGDLLTLRDWLAAHGVTHVAMESTGVYWRPVFYVLEDSFTCILANAAQIARARAQDRYQGLRLDRPVARARAHPRQLVPPVPLRELRDLTRHRKVLFQERTRHARLHKVLADAGITLASVASRLLGASGRAMLDTLVSGTTDPALLADLACGKLRRKLPALRQALTGRFRAHHAFLVSPLLAHLDYLAEAIDTVGGQIDLVMAPFTDELARLDPIPGVNQRTAEVLIAELGVDMTVLPTAQHLASWAGLCPGQNESVGKHRSGKTRHGNRWLRSALIEAALAASSRSTKGAFAARYGRIMQHRGHKKAVVAVAQTMLITVYHPERVRRRAIQTLERQGYRVTIEPAA